MENLFKKITREKTSAYQKHLEDLNLSEATVRRRLSSLRKFCNWAEKENYLEKNPFVIPISYRKFKIPTLPTIPTLLNAYRVYQSISITKYLHYAILIIFCASLGFGAYDQFFRKAPAPLAYPPASALVTPNRYLSFQGRLTDSSDNPISSSTSFRFALYNDLTASSSAQLWEEQRAITPDQDGIFSVILGTNVAISASVFTNNASIWLGVTVSQDSEMTPRQQIATVGYALNAETLQGIPPSASPSANKIPIITQSGDLVLAGASPRVYSTSGTFGIKGQALSITTDTGTNGNITVAPDGTGKLNINLGGATGNQMRITDANISGGALVSVYAGTNSTGFDLLNLSSGSSETEKFAVDYSGDASLAGGDITGANSVILDIGEASSSYVTSSVGFAVNGGTTYYFASTGNLNANTGTFAGNFSQTGVTTFSTGTGLVSINGNLATSLIPNSTSYNLGSATNYWGAIYANNYYAPGTGVSGYWQRNLGALSPANITDDLLVGGTATSSAKFQVLGTGASAGTVKIVAGQGIDTLAAGTLTIGGTTQTGLTLGRSGQSTTLAGNVQAFTLAGTITGSSSPNITSIGQFSGVTGVFSTSASSPLFQGNSAAVTFGNASYATTIAGSSTLTINPTSWTTTPTISGLITATLGLTANGALTANSTFTLGDNGETGSINTSDWDIGTTGDMTGIGAITMDGNFSQTGVTTFSTGTGLVSINGNLATSLIPNSTSYNLGSATNYWGAIYANNYYAPGTGVSGYWQRNLGTLSPTNITDDVLVGGTATSSALVRLPGITNQNAWFNLGTGNVGIGDTTPTEGKLVVAGTIYATTQATGVNEAVLGGRNLIAGAGLTGGGDLTADRTFNVGAGTDISVAADAINNTSTLATVTGRGASTTTQLAFNYNTGSPFTVLNSTVVTNLNADYLDGQHGSYYLPLANVSGTTNYVAKFTGTNSVGNSIIYDNGTNVGIGTTGPGAKLDIAGSSGTVFNQWTYSPEPSVYNLKLIQSVTSGDVHWRFVQRNANTDYETLTFRQGNVGIGTTDPGVYKLNVAGNTYIGGTLTTTGAITAGGNLDMQNNIISNIGNAGTDFIASTGGLTLAGDLRLNNNQILNSAGTAAINFSLTPSTSYNTLDAGNWLVSNTANLGQAALMINQTMGGDIFTASASGTPKVTITNSGNVGIGTAAPNYKLDVGPMGGAQSATAGSLGLIRNNAAADSSPYTQARIFVYGGAGVDTGNYAYFAYGADAQLREVYSKTASAQTMLWGTTSAYDGTGTFTQTMSLSAAGNLTVSGDIYAYGGQSNIIGNYGRMFSSNDEWLRINDDDPGGDYHTSGTYIDGPGVGMQGSLAVAGSNYGTGGYELYVNGDTYTTGALTAGGNLTVGGTFVSVGTTTKTTNLNADLLDGLDSTAFIQDLTPGDWEISSSSVNSVYYLAALEVRESNLGGVGTGALAEAPRIGFHWSGRVASQIGMDSGGVIRTFDNPGTGYANFAAASISANGDLNFSGKFNEDGVEILSGMIAAFAGTCPTGWTEYTAAQGRTVVGVPAAGTVAGTVGTALTNLGTRTITQVPSHLHTVNPPNTGTTTDGAHTHSVRVKTGGEVMGTRVASADRGELYADVAGAALSAGSHSHTVDIAQFDSGTTGVASVDVTMPYIQLRYCSKNAGADIAEWIPTNEVLTEKTIVSIDPDNREKVIASRKEYDSTVVGIIATQPGWLLGTENKESVQMALAGRVLARATLKNGEIKPGDPITTSTILGVGMKATKAGSIVGKAMEALNETSSLTDCYNQTTGTNEKCGTILVFVNISWYDPAGDASQDDLSADANNLFYEPLSFEDDLTNGDLVNLEYRDVPTENDPTKLERTGYIAKAQLSLGSPVGAISTEIGGQGELLRRERINNKIISEIRLVSFGKTEVKIASSSAAINPGDPITISSESGKGIKASNPGSIIGKALEEWTPDSGRDRILTFVSLSWYDPDVYLTSAGELKITRIDTNENTNKHEYSLVGSVGQVITRVGAFGEIAVANLRVGAVSASRIITDALQATRIDTEKLISPLVETGIISPLPDSSDVTIRLGRDVKDTPLQGGFGKLLIQNQQGETVASIDEAGNASFAGELRATQIDTDEIRINTDATVSGTLYADEIVTKHGKFGDLLANQITTSTINNIVQPEPTATPTPTVEPTPSEELTGLHPVTTVTPEASDSALLAEASSWEISDVSQDLKITSNLKVLGRTSLADTSIAGSLNVDGTLVIADSSINSLSGTLYLNSLGLGPVDILAGKVVIDIDGNVQIAGNLAVGGEISASKLAINAKESEFGKLMEIKSPTGETLVSIDASGSARFAQLTTEKIIIAANSTSEVSPSTSEVSTNATAGKATLPAGQTELQITNYSITNNSLIYLTPVSGTQNKVLYVKAKKGGEYFTAAIDVPIDSDIEFNWWIIN